MDPSRKSTTVGCTALLVCVGFLAELAQGANVPALYVLGDSLADVGNNNYLPTVLRADLPHNGIDYPGQVATGRFSNGYNFVDFLAEGLGLASPPAYHFINSNVGTTGSASVFLNGVNFASGGAGVSDITNEGQCFSFDDQIYHDYFGIYSELVQRLGLSQAQAHLAESLFTISIGGNDIIFNVLVPVENLPILTSPQQFIDSLALRLKRQMQRMYEHHTKGLQVKVSTPNFQGSKSVHNSIFASHAFFSRDMTGGSKRDHDEDAAIAAGRVERVGE